MTFPADALLERYRALDAQLVARGFPPTSPWWLATIVLFFTARRANRRLRRLVARVGRRGGKSSTLCRLAVLWAVAGHHLGLWQVPPGDIGVVAIVSATRDEANQRLRTIEAILTALGIRYRRTSEGIELDGVPVVFKVFVASLQSVIGFTAIMLLCDEVAAWRDAATGANPATEVLSHLRPTMATQTWAFEVLSSAPLAQQDAHYVAYERGDTEDQQTAFAPTWLANPTLTEADTHDLEPDLRVWSRAYAAIPQASVLGAFDAEAIDLAFQPREPGGVQCGRIMVIDASSGRKDAWTYGVAGWHVRESQRWQYVDPPPFKPYIRFDLVGGFEGSFWKQLTGEAVVQQLVEIANRHRVRTIVGDQREALMLESAFRRYGKHYRVQTWSAESKPKAVEQVRRWFADWVLALPEHKTLRRELLAFEERVTASGNFTFGARGSGHDDYVSLLITLAMAEREQLLPSSPTHGGHHTGGIYFDSVTGRVSATKPDHW